MQWAIRSAIVLITLLFATSCSQDEESVSVFRNTVPLETQLERLAEIGLTLNPGVSEDQLTTFDDLESLESVPYKGLVEVMGMEQEEEPFTPLCHQLWMCDYERVEDHGAYLEVLERLELMTSGALGVANARDFVDVDEEVAWLEFDHKDQRIRWDFRVDNDWLDPSILVSYDDLLQSMGSSLRIYSNETDYGQVVFFAAFRSDQKREFDKISSVKLTPLPRE